MIGINLDRDVIYKSASLRFFDKNERHVSRFCECDVLLLVYEGTLRFSEDGIPCEVSAGEYYIQKGKCYQAGEEVSDSPKYLYVHFYGDWSDGSYVLERRGKFNYSSLSQLINEIDRISRGNYSYTERAGAFFSLLGILYKEQNKYAVGTLSTEIADFLEEKYLEISSLEDICKEFHYSKNHIINIFKKEYGVTPFEYINDIKIRRAMYLLEVTSKSIDSICAECGFNHYSHFYRLFMRKNGISPFAWRESKKHPQ